MKDIYMKSKMYRAFVALFAMSAMFLSSCSDETTGISDGGEEFPEGNGIYCTVEQREQVGFDAESRSKLEYTSTGLHFVWEDNDKLSVFYSKTDEALQQYSLVSQRNADTKAYFNGGGFNLKKDEVYYALSKTTDTAPADCSFPNKGNLTFSFDGQRQTDNDNTAHLGKYDYMAASNACSADNLVSLHFKHLGPTLRVIIQAPENTTEASDFKAKHFTEMTMYSSDNTFRQPIRHLDLTKGLQLDNTYSPKWNDIDKTTAEYINAKPFTLKLGPAPIAPGTDEIGFQPNAKGNIIAYIQIPPEDFSGKNVVFTLKATDGKEYYSTFTGQYFDPAKAYQLVTRAKKATQFDITLKVKHLWQNGAEQDINSRATGDPGYDKDLKVPTHIYYIFCVDGKVKKVNEKAVNEIENIPENHWTTAKTAGDITSEYKGSGEKYQFTFSVTEAESNVPKNVYFVASTADLSSCFTGIAENTPESTVQALTYSIQGATQGESQAFLCNLYSTPFVSNETFVGKLTNPVQDVYLYHVAAKVDLLWNSTTKMSTSSPNNEIKITGVKESGLSLFKPTTNTNDAGSYNVTTPITEDTYYNGRQVYYLPQFTDNTYNVTIGPKVYDGSTVKTPKINFKETSIDGGYTSWLRALIKQ